MNERTRKIIIYSALFLAIIWGISNFLPKNGANTEAQFAAAPPLTAQTSVPANNVEKTINIAEMKSKSWGEDPFRAKSRRTVQIAKSSETIWRLSGIVYNSTKPLAIINGKSVSEGQRIGNATVLEISPKTVILDNAGAKVTLRVSKG